MPSARTDCSLSVGRPLHLVTAADTAVQHCRLLAVQYGATVPSPLLHLTKATLYCFVVVSCMLLRAQLPSPHTVTHTQHSILRTAAPPSQSAVRYHSSIIARYIPSPPQSYSLHFVIMSKPLLSFTARLTAKPGHVGELKAAIHNALSAAYEQPDFIVAYVNESADEADTVILYEQWSCTVDKLKTHYMGMSFFKEYKAALEPILLRPQVMEVMTPVEAFTKAGKQ